MQDVNHILHECRTANLRRLDLTDLVLVSIGASALWYFEWIHAACGMPKRHIGVEYYCDRPLQLPGNVEWIENTAGDMKDVPDGIADVVFSGQNIEHLWSFEVVGFLSEAHRILKPGGLCVIDSPNRMVTEKLGNAHPEHVVEFTPAEIEELLELAGFQVESMRGLILCQEPRTGKLLPLTDLVEAPPFSVYDRCLSSVDRPEESYIWWAHAIRTNRTPNRDAMRKRVDEIFSEAWPERLSRTHTIIGRQNFVGAIAGFESSAGESGMLMFGLYAPLSAGDHRISIRITRFDDADLDQPVAHVDVVSGYEHRELTSRVLLARDLPKNVPTEVAFDISVSETTFSAEIRALSMGVAALRVEKSVGLTGSY
jgi:SAM-dependent methyltransferase